MNAVSTLASGETSPAMERRVLLWAIFGVLAFALYYMLLARFGLDAYPLSGDEYSYRLGGEIFAQGHLKAPPPAQLDVFQVDHVVVDAAGVRTKYPPGWPALIALGWLVGLPWVACPVVGALTLALLFGVARRLVGLE